MRTVHSKLIVVGDFDCGKTCLLLTMSGKQFPGPDEYVPRPCVCEMANVVVDDTQVQSALWDTSGFEEYDHLRPLSYHMSDIVLICFSIGSPDSLTSVSERWNPEARFHCPNVPIILVGLKKDLRDDETTRYRLSVKSKEPVTEEEGRKMAEKIQAFQYFECSSKLNDGIHEVVEGVGRAVIHARNSKKERNLCLVCCML